jgi:opacity protein-like surface antigen
MRSLRLAIALAGLIAAPAVAQDAAGAEAWERSYIGPHAGYARFRSVYRENIDGAPDRQATDGYAFGAQLGHRWQSGSLVVGAELEATFPQVPDHDTRFPAIPLPVPVFQLDQRVSGRVKGQVGFASGNVLGYATAGLDATQLRLETAQFICGATCSFTGQPVAERRNFVGYVIGLGAAVRLGERHSLGIEATRSDYGRTFSGLNNYDVTSHAVLLRLNREF